MNTENLKKNSYNEELILLGSPFSYSPVHSGSCVVEGTKGKKARQRGTNQFPTVFLCTTASSELILFYFLKL